MIFSETFRHEHPLIPFVPNDPEGGFFRVPHPNMYLYFFNCLASISEDWEHVAVTLFKSGKMPGRCPTWEEMCFIKSIFWNDDECVMQLHPAKSEWVNNHPYCLHLWRPRKKDIPLPPSIMVGIKGL